MKFTKLINDELIEIREYVKPNACFKTNEYPDSYDFCILKEQFNPFDLFYDNKKKEKEIDRLNNIIIEHAEDKFIDNYIKHLEEEKECYKSRCEKAIEYIMSELITEWDIKNDGCVSGSDLPADAITPILNILNGSDEE